VRRYSDRLKKPFQTKTAHCCGFVRKCFECRRGSDAFQAYDEGSIPFTRSIFSMTWLSMRRLRRTTPVRKTGAAAGEASLHSPRPNSGPGEQLQLSAQRVDRRLGQPCNLRIRQRPVAE
jgi:hypothetical protein